MGPLRSIQCQSFVFRYHSDNKSKNNEATDQFVKSLFKHHSIEKDTDQIKIDSENIYLYKSGKIEFIQLTEKEKKIALKILGTGKSIELDRDKTGEAIASAIKQEKSATYYLFSSGGGGHKSAKDARVERDVLRMQEAAKAIQDSGDTETVDLDKRLVDPKAFLTWCKEMKLLNEADVLHDYLGDLGKWASSQWDEAQKSGDIKKQEKLASQQWMSDLFFGPVVFFSTLKNLVELKPKKVVSTQAMATPAILFALVVYNKLYKSSRDEDVKLHLYMTDMPTEYSKHFFNSLKQLPDIGGKDLLQLHAPKVGEGGKDWNALTGLSKEQVTLLETIELPVRPAFVQAATSYTYDSKTRSVQLKLSGEEERQFLEQTLRHQSTQLEKEEHSGATDYKLGAGDEAFFLMLGSQPTKSAIYAYIDQFSELAKQNPETPYHLFAFAGKFEGQSFYKELCESIQKTVPWPENLRVVPLSFQDPQQLVGLELQCHTITRSGGATTMELLVLDETRKQLGMPEKKHFVHAQQEGDRNLVDSIPVWEKGNFLVLQELIHAEVISPESLLFLVNSEKKALED